MRHRQSTYLRAGIVIATICAVGTAGAQIVRPSVPADARSITAAERNRGAMLAQGLGVISDDGRRLFTPEQLDPILRQRARQWLDALPPNAATGLQLDPLGQLAIITGQDELAAAQFARRVATPKLSVDDRAYTLLLAVRAFGVDAKNTARMQRALQYMARLDTMPVSAIVARFSAHSALGEAYYRAGDNTKVLAHLMTAFSLVPRVPFERRFFSQYNGIFLVLADVLSGLPDGRQRIDSMLTWLEPYTRPSAELLAQDSTLRWKGDGEARELQKMVTMTNLLGRKAPAITAHYWINTPPPSITDPKYPGTEVKTLDDGKIRVIEFGHYGCPGCIAALPRMEQLKQRLPSSVEVWMVADEGDVWGATRCTPDEMVQHLTQFYVAKNGYTLPIAIWIGPRKPDSDGGTVLEESPTEKAYEFFSYPTFAVIDGKGIVRRISASSEETLLSTVQYLLAEQGHSSDLIRVSPSASNAP
jgi:thiol-disulfide isomerase/thioredoxin